MFQLTFGLLPAVPIVTIGETTTCIPGISVYMLIFIDGNFLRGPNKAYELSFLHSRICFNSSFPCNSTYSCVVVSIFPFLLPSDLIPEQNAVSSPY